MYIRTKQSTIDKLISKKMDFVAICTNYSIRIKSPLGNFIIGETMKNSEINFIQKVKRAVKAGDKKPPEYEPVWYYRFGSNIKDFKEAGDLWEVDLKSAYWEAAYKLKYLPEDIYKKGLVIDKKLRLKALGSLATKKKIITYTAGQETDLKTERDEITTKIWFDICHQVGELLGEGADRLIEKNLFAFFWTDAIFFKGTEEKAFIESLFHKAGYKFESRKIKAIEIIENFEGYKIPMIKVTDYPESIKNKSEERYFPLLKNKPKFFNNNQ